MQISGIQYNYCAKNIKKINNTTKFGSLFADANPETESQYGRYTMTHPDFAIMKCSSTRIFRDLPSELAMARILDPNQKSQIKVLGCADGSEAWGYAIAVKEAMGEKAKNVKIEGIDKAPYMIEAAKTGCLVLSDIEKKYAQGASAIYPEKSPIAGDGWNKYLTKTGRPKGFDEVQKKYPYMKYLEFDPVVKKGIGSGLDWYEVNKDGLPDVSFECADMLDCLSPDKEADNVVYVMANSAGYVFEKDPNEFLRIFQEIKNNNKGKNVYVIMGNVEDKILNSTVLGIPYEIQYVIKNYIRSLGFKNITSDELSRLGIISKNSTSKKIYKLATE